LHLDDSDEAREQVAFADVLVLNKIDLVEPAEADALERRLRGMNAMARVLRSHMAQVPLTEVLDLGGFDLDRALERKPTFLEPEYPFEWAGIFELPVGGARLVVGDGPDASMKVLLRRVSGRDEQAVLREAERAFRDFSGDATVAAPGATLEPFAVRRLDIEARGTKEFPIDVREPGLYVLFTEHTPEELDLRVLARDEAVQPVAARHFAAGHTHDDTVTSVGIEVAGKVDVEKFNKWISSLLREKGADIFRSKGILDVAGEDRRFVFQGVHMLLDANADRPWGRGPRANQLCFIGRKLDRAALVAGFRSCLA
jgi:G3E family GTPase